MMRKPVLLLATMLLTAHLGRAQFSWQEPQAKVNPAGGLEWAPKAFAFEKGSDVRYIDFEKGDDTADGTTPQTAWKRHPLDPQAAGLAKAGAGADTFIFKRGVIYRGSLVGKIIGTKQRPVRLTSDPAWGTGEVVISGADAVTGWKKGANRADIPDADKVWVAQLDYAPRCVWAVAGNGAITRIPLARTPNWKVSDPDDVTGEWHEWEQPQWWTDKNKTTVNGTKMHLGIDTKHLTGPAQNYVGGVVWSEWGIVMGTPFASKIESYDPARKGIGFQGFWRGDSGKIITKNRYFVEDRPQFLDAPGEFWFDKNKGEGGTLYLRLPDDVDPNTVRVEAAHRSVLMEFSQQVQNVKITGLTFRFTNVNWMYWESFWWWQGGGNIWLAAIRMLDASDVDNSGKIAGCAFENVQISNCTFEHVNSAVRIRPKLGDTRMDGIVFSDNDIRFTDQSAIEIGGDRAKKPPTPFIGDVKVLRNRLTEIGRRPWRGSSAHAIVVNFPETLEVAGNILKRTYGSGIFVFLGKNSDSATDAPLARGLVHHNFVDQSLLAANDWGGIETWQGGPMYVFDNISKNPGGYWNWGAKPGSQRLGFAYYLDGGFKNYHFNNIAWGVNNDLNSKYCNHTAFYHAVPTILDSFFNNTAYKFSDGSGWSPVGGRQLYLGNVWSDISQGVFDHGKQKEDEKANYSSYSLESVAYSRNVFDRVPQTFGGLEGAGAVTNFDGFKGLAAKGRLVESDVGVLAKSPPLLDPDKGDFRPAPGSAALGNGVKFFVPWALARTVGEWNFRADRANPDVTIDEHWYMSPAVEKREKYYLLPRNDLHGDTLTLARYERGPLEDWTSSAIKFQGRGNVLTLAPPAAETFPGPHNTDEGNFLVEVVFRAEAASKGGALVSCIGERGYELGFNAQGAIAFRVKADAEVTAISPAPVTDGKWHHVLAEADRKAGELRLYLDGKRVTEQAAMLNGSTRHVGKLLVGETAAGAPLIGSMDFLRIALSSLAESKTSIEELYAWEFDGPFLRDFAGHKSTDKRAAGAVDANE